MVAEWKNSTQCPDWEMLGGGGSWLRGHRDRRYGTWKLLTCDTNSLPPTADDHPIFTGPPSVSRPIPNRCRSIQNKGKSSVHWAKVSLGQHLAPEQLALAHPPTSPGA